jgi:hypothetical protein
VAVKFDVSRCPICGGPLEPAYEYGHTILKCPYCGYYTYATITGGKFASEVPIVTPKWTFHGRQALKIIENELEHAYLEATKGDIERAYNRLVWIQDTIGAMPREVQDLPILRKLGTSIGKAENYYIFDENPDRFIKEVIHLRNVYKGVAPSIGGKRRKKR